MATYKLLFLCTGNSARSILGEYLLRHKGGDRFESFSAGAAPKPNPHPIALQILKNEYGIDASDAKSESWEVYHDAGLDFVITVCDNAAESCPIWPGDPIVGHWQSPDPAHYDGSEEEHYRFFLQVAKQIEARIDLLLSTEDGQLTGDSGAVKATLDAIGQQVTELPELV
ncbi:MAG: arsenate reductase ArsC [Verrucomicrobiota bacterium]